MKNLVLLLVAAALAAVLLVFLLVGGWSTVHRESVSTPEPIVETTREAAV